MYQPWRVGGGAPGDAGIINFISQPVFEVANQDVLCTVGEPASQVMELLGVLGYPSASLADSLDMVSGFAISSGGRGGPQTACGVLP